MSDVFGELDVYLVCLFVSGPMAAIVIAFICTYCMLQHYSPNKDVIVTTIPDSRPAAGEPRAALQQTHQKSSNLDGTMDTDVMFNSAQRSNGNGRLGVSSGGDDTRSGISMASMAVSNGNSSMSGGGQPHQQTGLGQANALFANSGHVSPSSPQAPRVSRNRPPLPNAPPPLPGQEVESGQKKGKNVPYPSFFNAETVPDIYDMAEQSDKKRQSQDADNIYDPTS